MKYPILTALVCFAACGDSTPDAGPTDTGVTLPSDGGDPIIDAGFEPDGAPVRTVEVGTGVDGFIPIATSEQMTMILGPQGGGRYMGYHIWSAIKVIGFQPRSAKLRFKILAADRTELARQERMLNLMPSNGAYVAYGVAPWLDDCCAVRNQPLIMHAEIEDSTGATGQDERMVIGGDRCPDPGGADICP